MGIQQRPILLVLQTCWYSCPLPHQRPTWSRLRCSRKRTETGHIRQNATWTKKTKKPQQHSGQKWKPLLTPNSLAMAPNLHSKRRRRNNAQGHPYSDKCTRLWFRWRPCWRSGDHGFAVTAEDTVLWKESGPADGDPNTVSSRRSKLFGFAGLRSHMVLATSANSEDSQRDPGWFDYGLIVPAPFARLKEYWKINQYLQSTQRTQTFFLPI